MFQGGCFGYARVSVTVTAAPQATATATPNPVKEYNQVRFMASPGISYKWSGPNGFSSTLQNPVINKVTRYMSGIYTVTVTNENGCPSIARVSLRVNYTNRADQSITDGEGEITTRTEVSGTVYPNPTADMLYFDTESKEAIEYIIYDMSGTVQSQLRSVRVNYISTTNLQSGVYHIRWKAKDQAEWIDSRFVKIR